MPKIISLEEARRLLAAGEYDSFLDAVETEHLEFKAEPYRLENELQKQELAKDVTGLANAAGGAILIGFKTTKDASVLADYVADLRPIPSDQFRAEQYQSIIQDWVYPTPTVTFQCFPTFQNRVFVAIDVSAGDADHVPHLVKRIATDEGKRVEVMFGYFERRQTNVPHSSVQHIHALIRSGLRMREMTEQYGLIHDTLQQLVDFQNGVSEVKTTQANMAQRAAEFDRDKKQAIAAGGFESIPNLLLSAYPTDPVQMRGLFNPAESDLIQALQSHPDLKETAGI